MGTRPAAGFYTIAVHQAFADTLVAGIMARHGPGSGGDPAGGDPLILASGDDPLTLASGNDPLALASGMLLLPNARAVATVRDAFVRASGAALLLPRLVTLGEGDFESAGGGALDRIDDEPSLPAIDQVRRRLVLARLIGDVRAASKEPATAVEALALAEGLAVVIDQLLIEDVPFDRLVEQSEVEALAEHRTKAIDLLQKLAERWPQTLAQLGLTDVAELRNNQFSRAAARWAAHGLPTRWLIAAGISTSAPAVADLLRVIGQAPGGAVVLPHIDLAMTGADWDALGDDPRTLARQAGDAADAVRARATHPQYHLKLLLDRMAIRREDVAQWVDGTAPGFAPGPLDGPAARAPYVAHLLAPDYLTARWSALPDKARKLPNVAGFTCATEADEALTIALALREVLDTPGKTAALATPDRAIAARVAGHLTRWGIKADDSAGQPLPATPTGALLLALADAGGSGFAPVELVALLSHPLVGHGAAGGNDRQTWLDRVRELDLLLRGPRPAPGLAALTAVIETKRATERFPQLAAWWAQVAAHLSGFALRVEPRGGSRLALILPALRAALSTLAGDTLWGGAAGRALAARIEALSLFADDWPAPIIAADLGRVLHALIADVAVRPPGDGSPRLFIWGLLEARLQRADRMVLAGLNEGQWPQLPSPDAWLAPGLRRRLGLPEMDRQLGLSAHDFGSALAAPEVIITRAARQGSSPTLPSRFWLRIEALNGTMPGAGATDYAAIASALDAPALVAPARRPQPAPPVRDRVRAVSASALDTLRADPFAWYARQMLGLRPLEMLDAQPEAAWRGTMAHKVIENWHKAGDLSQAAMDATLTRALDDLSVAPILRTLWGPKLRQALSWVVTTIDARIADGGVPLAAEIKGDVVIGGITLSGKADRIDRLPDGRIAIIDYKTGGSPPRKQVVAGHALQLGLLGAIAEHGHFGTDAATRFTGDAGAFEYWRLNRDPTTKTFGKVDPPLAKADGALTDATFVAEALRHLHDAAARWLHGDAPFTAKLLPDYAPYADYNQLMRLDEWYGQLVRDTDAGHPPDAAT